MHIKSDCRFFLGDRPCKYHKLFEMECEACQFYQSAPERVLIVKLGAAGDVVRTTPLLAPLRERHPRALIYWLTDYPELVPQSVDRILKFSYRNQLVLQATPWRAIYNLDKDAEACALVNLLYTPEQYGFKLDNGVCVPINEMAHDKWLTGLSDPLNKANTLSYLEEIFLISGFQYRGEPYLLDEPSAPTFLHFSRGAGVVGLNTGCGTRWLTRKWPESHWLQLIQYLQHAGLQVLILGGPDEHSFNLELARKSGALYPGYYPLKEFVGLVAACDLVVTGVTLALHLALGLQKRVVLMNNIFNRHEFELFGLGEILEPELSCLGCFKSTCSLNCMALITPDQVFASVLHQLDRESSSSEVGGHFRESARSPLWANGRNLIQ
ncbi:MAG: glycosyltransferase family 9 protein [Deltaproteobacteria bacterium]|nr:glycosyltransferase family 9 protein [Deltaproteobacteria bacterium]